MPEIDVNSIAGSFRVELENDFYGLDFWRSVENLTFERDTQSFLYSEIKSGTVFLDIGAANGSMSLIAAKLGGRVTSYEPNPIMHAVSLKNFALNPDVADRIELFKVAVSDHKTTIEADSFDSSIVSDINFPLSDTSFGESMEVISLADEINRLSSGDDSRIVIKMDIEGAEWRICKIHIFCKFYNRQMLSFFSQFTRVFIDLSV